MGKRSHEEPVQPQGQHTRFIDRFNAEKLCQKKLKRTSNLYKKVLVRNTLKYVQSSNEDCFPFENFENIEPRRKVARNDEDLIDAILTEMIFPRSVLPSPEELSLDWPTPPPAECQRHQDEEDFDAAIVPDIEITEDTADDEFLATIFGDRTNCTVTKLLPQKCVSSSKPEILSQCRNNPNCNSEYFAKYRRSPPHPGLRDDSLPAIRPDISLMPATINMRMIPSL